MGGPKNIWKKKSYKRHKGPQQPSKFQYKTKPVKKMHYSPSKRKWHRKGVELEERQKQYEKSLKKLPLSIGTRSSFGPSRRRAGATRRKRKSNKSQSQQTTKKMKQGDVDLFELADIFKSIKKKKTRSHKTKGNNTSGNGQSSNADTLQAIKSGLDQLSTAKSTAKGTAAVANSFNGSNESNGSNSKSKKPLTVKQKMRALSKTQLEGLPHLIKIPKCSLCHYELCIKRGDQCYESSYSASCDYCGREDIHGNVWHCDKCAVQKDRNGFNLCTTCGYLISHGRQREIRRVAPPTDDLGLLFNKAGRNRRVTMDGLQLYKQDEIAKELKIGRGRDTRYCPFDCKCCF